MNLTQVLNQTSQTSPFVAAKANERSKGSGQIPKKSLLAHLKGSIVENDFQKSLIDAQNVTMTEAKKVEEEDPFDAIVDILQNPYRQLIKDPIKSHRPAPSQTEAFEQPYTDDQIQLTFANKNSSIIDLPIKRSMNPKLKNDSIRPKHLVTEEYDQMLPTARPMTSQAIGLEHSALLNSTLAPQSSSKSFFIGDSSNSHSEASQLLKFSNEGQRQAYEDIELLNDFTMKQITVRPQTRTHRGGKMRQSKKSYRSP